MSAKSSPPPNGPPCTEGGRLMAERAVGTDRGDRGVLRGRGRALYSIDYIQYWLACSTVTRAQYQ